jgi:hypothetical protein
MRSDQDVLLQRMRRCRYNDGLPAEIHTSQMVCNPWHSRRDNRPLAWKSLLGDNMARSVLRGGSPAMTEWSRAIRDRDDSVEPPLEGMPEEELAEALVNELGTATTNQVYGFYWQGSGGYTGPDKVLGTMQIDEPAGRYAFDVVHQHVSRLHPDNRRNSWPEWLWSTDLDWLLRWNRDAVFGLFVSHNIRISTANYETMRLDLNDPNQEQAQLLQCAWI